MAPPPRPVLTREQGLEMEELLIVSYCGEDFQRNLHSGWNAAGEDPVKQAQARHDACLPLQMPVVSRYGFEASRRGVAMSVAAFNAFDSGPDLVVRGELLRWLVDPVQQRETRQQRCQQLHSCAVSLACKAAESDVSTRSSSGNVADSDGSSTPANSPSLESNATGPYSALSEAAGPSGTASEVAGLSATAPSAPALIEPAGPSAVASEAAGPPGDVWSASSSSGMASETAVPSVAYSGAASPPGTASEAAGPPGVAAEASGMKGAPAKPALAAAMEQNSSAASTAPAVPKQQDPQSAFFDFDALDEPVAGSVGDWVESTDLGESGGPADSISEAACMSITVTEAADLLGMASAAGGLSRTTRETPAIPGAVSVTSGLSGMASEPATAAHPAPAADSERLLAGSSAPSTPRQKDRQIALFDFGELETLEAGSDGMQSAGLGEASSGMDHPPWLPTTPLRDTQPSLVDSSTLDVQSTGVEDSPIDDHFEHELALACEISARCDMEAAVEMDGGIRGSLMLVRPPWQQVAEDAWFVDAANEGLSEFQRLVEEHGTLIELVSTFHRYLTAAWTLIVALVHLRFEPAARIYFQGFVDLLAAAQAAVYRYHWLVDLAWFKALLAESYRLQGDALKPPLLTTEADRLGQETWFREHAGQLLGWHTETLWKALELLAGEGAADGPGLALRQHTVALASVMSAHGASGAQNAEAEHLAYVAHWRYELPIHRLTLQLATRMLVELRDAFSEGGFQRRYRNCRQNGTHVQAALSVQAEVLPRYGFPGTLEGVLRMRTEVDKLAEGDAALRKVQHDIWRLLKFREALPTCLADQRVQELGHVPAWSDATVPVPSLVCRSPGCKLRALRGKTYCCPECSHGRAHAAVTFDFGDEDDAACDSDGHGVLCTRLSAKTLWSSWWESCWIDKTAQEMCTCLVVPPLGFKDAAAPAPVILFLTGVGHVDDKEDFLQGGVDLLLRNQLVRQEYVVVAPRPTIASGVLCPNEWGKAGWREDGVWAILTEVLRRLTPRHVHPGRLYITGVSLGATGLWRVVSKYGRMLAAAAPVSGPAEWPEDAWPRGAGPSEQLLEVLDVLPLRAYEIDMGEERSSPQHDLEWLCWDLEERRSSLRCRGLDPGSELQVDIRQWPRRHGGQMELWSVPGPLHDCSWIDRAWGGDCHCLWWRAYPFKQWGLPAFFTGKECPEERRWRFTDPPLVLDGLDESQVNGAQRQLHWSRNNGGCDARFDEESDDIGCS